MNPYSQLPPEAFWQSGVSQASPFSLQGIFRPKFRLGPSDRIATAGSCFAQHLSRSLRAAGMTVMDVEPPAAEIEQSSLQRFGYKLYSARYGNIYTSQQLLTIAKEALLGHEPVERVWSRGSRFIDAMRPAVEPEGLSSELEVLRHRAYHLSRVRELFTNMDVFVFTLGLTEGWEHRFDRTTYPIAPGIIGGVFDPAFHAFKNYGFDEVKSALEDFRSIVINHREGRPFRMLLTVSPVPMTATGSGAHVLSATTYSKSVLRAVAGELCTKHDEIDYFPSFEIITNPALRSVFYEANLRTVQSDGVKTVMNCFFKSFALEQKKNQNETDLTHAERREQFIVAERLDDQLQCEEYMLGAFRD
jgi:hypothetical protein